MDIRAELDKVDDTGKPLMGLLAKQILKAVVLHGGKMDHRDIVKSLGIQSDADIRDAFAQCRASKLIYDQAPSPLDQRQTWYAAPALAADLLKQVDTI